MSRSVKKYSDWASQADQIDTSFSILVDKYSEINLKDDSETRYANFDAFSKENGDETNVEKSETQTANRVTIIEKVIDQDDKENHLQDKTKTDKHRKSRRTVVFADENEKPPSHHHKKKKKKKHKKDRTTKVDDLPTVTETRYTKQEVPIFIAPDGSQIFQSLNGSLVQSDNNIFSAGPIILSDDITELNETNFVQTLGGNFIPLVNKESQILSDGVQSITVLDPNTTTINLSSPLSQVSNLQTLQASQPSFIPFNESPLIQTSNPSPLTGYKRTTITTTTRQVNPSVSSMPPLPMQTVSYPLPYGAVPIRGSKVECYSLGTNPPIGHLYASSTPVSTPQHNYPTVPHLQSQTRFSPPIEQNVSVTQPQQHISTVPQLQSQNRFSSPLEYNLSHLLNTCTKMNEPNDFRRALLRRLQQFGTVCNDMRLSMPSSSLPPVHPLSYR